MVEDDALFLAVALKAAEAERNKLRAALSSVRNKLRAALSSDLFDADEWVWGNSANDPKISRLMREIITQKAALAKTDYLDRELDTNPEEKHTRPGVQRKDVL
jgi:predicted DNA-binding transcriptional regulator YafY